MMSKYLVIEKHGEDDYSVTLTDVLSDETEGMSVRGSLAEIRSEITTELTTVKDLENELKKHGWKEAGIGLWVYPDYEYFIDTNTEIGMLVERGCTEASRYGNVYKDLIK